MLPLPQSFTLMAEGIYQPNVFINAAICMPPLAYAIATVIRKNRFSEAFRETGKSNWAMGFVGITEGAIPFASSDPVRVLVSSIIGSAIAGGLSMFFGCTLMAPHGGIFVIPVVGNPLMYIVSIVVGSIVAALIMAAWKNNVWEE